MTQLYRAYLQREAYEVRTAETGAEALEALRRQPPDVIILDLNLPDMPGREILAEVSRQELPSSVIVATTEGSIKVAVDVMRAGAFDFLVKPFAAERLVTTVRNAVEHARLSSEVDALKDSLKDQADRDQFCGFVGASPAMQSVYRLIEAAAPSTATVFITGESGTGKELAAQAIHRLSRRAAGPFVPINCGAIPKDLIESELFGHVKGSFTGAVADRPGAARLANGGTLFLDEICEMQIDLQTKLLRFLQTGTFQPVGTNKLERVDLRIVCATNRDPQAEVVAGRFREDLFYRLYVLPLELPPLRERLQDAVLIARALLPQLAKEERKRFRMFSPDAEALLLTHSWPGNVRELENVLRHAAVMHDGTELTSAMLPIRSAPAAPERAVKPVLMPEHAPSPGAVSPMPSASPHSWRREADIVTLDRLERVAIERAIEVCAGNVPRAAAFLGVSASTIYRKKQAWESNGRAASRT